MRNRIFRFNKSKNKEERLLIVEEEIRTQILRGSVLKIKHEFRTDFFE